MNDKQFSTLAANIRQILSDQLQIRKVIADATLSPEMKLSIITAKCNSGQNEIIGNIIDTILDEEHRNMQQRKPAATMRQQVRDKDIVSRSLPPLSELNAIDPFRGKDPF